MFPPRTARVALYRAMPLVLWGIPSFAQFVPNRYTVLLEDPPVATRFPKREDMQAAAARGYRNQIEARQQQVRSELASRNIPVTGSVATVLNAVFVIAPASRISEMLAIPGVAAVRPMRRFQMLLNKATQLMNGPAAWAALGGQANAGRGMKIAIIDTGIDQTHPAFQDSSLQVPTGFPKCSGFSGNCADFTSNKVIVARSYVPQLAGFSSKNPTLLPDDISVPPDPATSQPDDYTPRDRVGHGTATASAAAANTTTGPAIAAGGGNVTFSGMAPKAYLGNYKIFGSPGVNDGPTDGVMIQAINDALADGMDVASISVGAQALTGALDTGAACGLAATTPCDPVALAYEAAARAGLVVVAAAGNSGSDAALLYGQNYPYFNSISSPSTAPSVISVGATTNSHVLTPAVSVNAQTAPANVQGLAAQAGNSTFFPSSLGANMAPLIDVTQLGDDGLACRSLPAYSLLGAYALIERGSCAFATKASNAQAAGAVGLIFYMADSSAPISPDVLSANFVGPAVMVSEQDGQQLKSYIDLNPGQMVTIDLGGLENDLTAYQAANHLSLTENELASYSSFGPTPDGAIKPDLVATGGLDGDLAFAAGMYLPVQNYDPNGALYSQNRYAAGDGTSFSTPLVAGAAAMVKQAHPNYTSAQIRSALVNSASPTTTTDDGHLDGMGNLEPAQPVTVEWLGAGRLDAGAALQSTLTVEPATLSFGYLKTDSLPITKTLTITNQSASPATMALAVAPNGSPAAATVAVNPSSLSLAAGAAGTVTVTLSGTVPAAGSYSGTVTATSGSAVERAPYLFLVPDGVPYNIVPLFGSIQGTPGQDGGSVAIQVVDQYGVPVSGNPVVFSVVPSGAVTFQTVPGEPACSPDSLGAMVCNTDNYGIAYAEVILGPHPGSSTITATADLQRSQFTAFILPQPTITADQNGYQILDNAAFLPGGGVAPGSVAAIKGSNMMDGSLLQNTAQGYDVANTSVFPLVLDGVSVSFDVPAAGISVPAPVVAVSAHQINVQVPWELAGQTSAEVKVILDEASGPAIYGSVGRATLTQYTPAFFTNSGNVADALHMNPDGTFNYITKSTPAIRGEIISLFANGLGPVKSQPADGAPPGAPAETTTPCTVTIGGESVAAQFCGITQYIFYQVDVQVPANLSPGSQPITISVGGKTSPTGIVIPVE